MLLQTIVASLAAMAAMAVSCYLGRLIERRAWKTNGDLGFTEPMQAGRSRYYVIREDLIDWPKDKTAEVSHCERFISTPRFLYPSLQPWAPRCGGSLTDITV